MLGPRKKNRVLGIQNYTLKLPKSRLGTPPRAKMHARGAEDQPRGAQERPRGDQESPKSAQETPKRRPRGAGRPLISSKIDAAKARNASRTRSGAFGEHVADLSSKKAFSKASANEFRSFFSMIAKSVNLDFYRPCRGFRRFFENARCSIHACARRDPNIEKGMSEASKICPGRSKTLQNRARRAAGH